MSITEFLNKLRNQPQDITFANTIALIESHYTFTPTRFSNGDVVNEAGANSGSCKLFAFAQLQQLTEQETLYCFGAYYRQDVLEHPEATSHANIRNFVRTGWGGIHFDGVALAVKE
jgi:hypothetical protein